MFRRFASLVLLTAFILSCGGHWYVLQGIAWTNMVREFSEHVPLVTAVKMAVSGEYPCNMCKAIAEKKKQEKSEQTKLPDFKKDFVADLNPILAEPFSAPLIYPVAQECSFSFRDAPAIPPPRRA